MYIIIEPYEDKGSGFQSPFITDWHNKCLLFPRIMVGVLLVIKQAQAKDQRNHTVK